MIILKIMVIITSFLKMGKNLIFLMKKIISLFKTITYLIILLLLILAGTAILPEIRQE